MRIDGTPGQHIMLPPLGLSLLELSKRGNILKLLTDFLARAIVEFKIVLFRFHNKGVPIQFSASFTNEFL